MGDYTQVPTPPADPVATPSAQPDAPVPDPNRPVSTIPADSSEATPPAHPPPADSVSQPVPEPKLQPDQVFEASASADVIPPADPSPAPTVPVVADVPVQVVPPTQAEPQSQPVSTPVEPPKESSIQDHSPSNQPSQAQPEAPADTPVIQVENTPSQSAGINPEPLEVTQNTPPADSKPPESPKTSFGDLSAPVQPVPSTTPPVVISPPQPSSPPASQSQPIPPPVEIPQPVSSFGDLMEKPADLSEEPAIHIDPIEAPKETTPASLSSDQQQKEEFTQRRQRANAVRKQKKDGNLVQILEFVQKKGIVKNLDVRDFLHISQTTATDYLHTLVSSGKLKKEGKAKATMYSL